MSTRFRPLLASECDIKALRLPVLASPKLDGIRCVIRRDEHGNAWALSRSLKPIRNTWIQGLLRKLPVGLDGELIAGNTFQACMSHIMTEVGWGFNWEYRIFDYIGENDDYRFEPFHQRLARLKDLELPGFCERLVHFEMNSKEEILEKVAYYGSLAYPNEGLMTRDPNGEYKFGRSTPRQQLLCKFKLFDDSEARIIGFEEKLTNTNEQEWDKLGYQKRNHSKAGMVPAGTLGSFILRDIHTDVEFNCGSGLDDETRQQVWDNRDAFLGQLVKYKWQIAGSKDKPRIPIFLGFRAVEDLDAK